MESALDIRQGSKSGSSAITTSKPKNTCNINSSTIFRAPKDRVVSVACDNSNSETHNGKDSETEDCECDGNPIESQKVTASEPQQVNESPSRDERCSSTEVDPVPNGPVRHRRGSRVLVYIRDIGPHCTEKDLWKLLSRYGNTLEMVHIKQCEIFGIFGIARFREGPHVMAAMEALDRKWKMRGCDIPIKIEIADEGRYRSSLEEYFKRTFGSNRQTFLRRSSLFCQDKHCDSSETHKKNIKLPCKRSTPKQDKGNRAYHFVPQHPSQKGYDTWEYQNYGAASIAFNANLGFESYPLYVNQEILQYPLYTMPYLVPMVSSQAQSYYTIYNQPQEYYFPFAN